MYFGMRQEDVIHYGDSFWKVRFRETPPGDCVGAAGGGGGDKGLDRNPSTNLRLVAFSP